MMVPIEYLLALTAIFFIREVYQNYTRKRKARLYYKYFGDFQSKEYQNGYFKAYKEMAEIWDSDIKGGKDHETRLLNLGNCILNGLNRRWGR